MSSAPLSCKMLGPISFLYEIRQFDQIDLSQEPSAFTCAFDFAYVLEAPILKPTDFNTVMALAWDYEFLITQEPYLLNETSTRHRDIGTLAKHSLLAIRKAGLPRCPVGIDEKQWILKLNTALLTLWQNNKYTRPGKSERETDRVKRNIQRAYDFLQILQVPILTRQFIGDMPRFLINYNMMITALSRKEGIPEVLFHDIMSLQGMAMRKRQWEREWFEKHKLPLVGRLQQVEQLDPALSPVAHSSSLLLSLASLSLASTSAAASSSTSASAVLSASATLSSTSPQASYLPLLPQAKTKKMRRRGHPTHEMAGDAGPARRGGRAAACGRGTRKMRATKTRTRRSEKGSARVGTCRLEEDGMRVLEEFDAERQHQVTTAPPLVAAIPTDAHDEAGYDPSTLHELIRKAEIYKDIEIFEEEEQRQDKRRRVQEFEDYCEDLEQQSAKGHTEATVIKRSVENRLPLLRLTLPSVDELKQRHESKIRLNMSELSVPSLVEKRNSPPTLKSKYLNLYLHPPPHTRGKKVGQDPDALPPVYNPEFSRTHQGPGQFPLLEQDMENDPLYPYEEVNRTEAEVAHADPKEDEPITMLDLQVIQRQNGEEISKEMPPHMGMERASANMLHYSESTFAHLQDMSPHSPPTALAQVLGNRSDLCPPEDGLPADEVAEDEAQGTWPQRNNSALCDIPYPRPRLITNQSKEWGLVSSKAWDSFTQDFPDGQIIWARQFIRTARGTLSLQWKGASFFSEGFETPVEYIEPLKDASMVHLPIGLDTNNIIYYFDLGPGEYMIPSKWQW